MNTGIKTVALNDQALDQAVGGGSKSALEFGVLGAQTGLLVGGMVGPVGAGIGGAIGGLLGGIGGMFAKDHDGPVHMPY